MPARCPGWRCSPGHGGWVRTGGWPTCRCGSPPCWRRAGRGGGAGGDPGPHGHAHPWPTAAGLGGAAGAVLEGDALAAGAGLLGPAGPPLVWALGAALAILLVVLALGLTAGEWRTAALGARRAGARCACWPVPAQGWLAARASPAWACSTASTEPAPPPPKPPRGGRTGAAARRFARKRRPRRHQRRRRPPGRWPRHRRPPARWPRRPADMSAGDVTADQGCAAGEETAAGAPGEPPARGRLALPPARPAEVAARAAPPSAPPARRRCRPMPGCWNRCWPTTACRARSSKSGPARW